MKYFQTYQCGHTGFYVARKGMKASEVTKRLQKVFSGECDACRGVDSSLTTEMVEELTAFYELPELKGTEKQIAWAKHIRVSRYESVMNRGNLVDRLEILLHSKMITHAEYWVKARSWSVEDFNAKTSELYNSLKSGDVRYRKLKTIEAGIQTAKEKPELKVSYTGIPERYVVTNRDIIFGLYSFKQEAEQGLSIIEQQLPRAIVEISEGLPF